ncbi:MAG: hypothetical protein MUW51_08685 [Lactococcus lactis]|nr:hypothetical protein [Lactococcus lactis]
MNKPIYETIKSYGDNLETTTTKIIVGYERVTRKWILTKEKAYLNDQGFGSEG